MPLHDIDAILDRIDLEQLADELCGPRRGRGSGARWPSPVPDHPQTGKTPPRSIFTDRRGRQRFTCWSTGTSGSAIDLVSVNRHMDISSSIQWLADRAGQVAEPIKRVPQPSTPKRTGASKALRDYVAACRAELYKPFGETARQWLERRCLNPAVLELNDIGFDPGPNKLRRARGLPCRGPGIVLPTFGRMGKPCLRTDPPLRPRHRRPQVRQPVRQACDKAHRELAPAARPRPSRKNLCEGVIDALTVAGVRMSSVAILAAGDSTRAVAELSRSPNPLVLALDPDQAGRAASTKALDGLIGSGRAHDRAAVLRSDLNELAQGTGERFELVLRSACSEVRPIQSSGVGR